VRKTSLSTYISVRREYFVQATDGWTLIVSSMKGLAPVVALALTVVAFAILGAGPEGTVLALKLTARWSFLLFWIAYVGAPLAKLWGPRFDGIARQGRELGLAFASAQLAHVGLVFWLFRVASGPSDRMLFFWAGILCTYLLALLSFVQFRRFRESRVWWWLRTFSIEYIAFVFALDFILEPLRARGLDDYPWTYVPFALMLFGGAGLRLAAYAQYTSDRVKSGYSGAAT